MSIQMIQFIEDADGNVTQKLRGAAETSVEGLLATYKAAATMSKEEGVALGVAINGVFVHSIDMFRVCEPDSRVFGPFLNLLDTLSEKYPERKEELDRARSVVQNRNPEEKIAELFEDIQTGAYTTNGAIKSWATTFANLELGLREGELDS